MRRRWAFGRAFGQALAIELPLDKLEPASNGSVLRSAPRRSNKILFAVSAIQASLAVKVGGWGLGAFAFAQFPSQRQNESRMKTVLDLCGGFLVAPKCISLMRTWHPSRSFLVFLVAVSSRLDTQAKHLMT